MSWRPSAALEQLEARAALVDGLRQFFKVRGSLEVEVPAIAPAPASDPWIDSFKVIDPAGVTQGYLLSSPETYLKRLLAAYKRPIHSLGKAYRANEQGHQHAVEFTMLEWYRLGDNDPFHAMISEIQDLIRTLTPFGAPVVCRYRDVFESAFGISPHQANAKQLSQLATPILGAKTASSLDLDSLLNLLFSTEIEPGLTNHLVIDFPAVQAALSRIEVNEQGDSVAKRAELYLDGVEIANGYHELTDANEQRDRFIADQANRSRLHRPQVPLDEDLLAALTSGLPDSYGVALGVDRLVMACLGCQSLGECMTFWESP
jgi:elongation factor P--(R)-beta-lysine ligase